jgi:hypothetical protein
MDQEPNLKHCPICSKDLIVSEFGTCRSRRDGRNLYCKSCVRQKVEGFRKGKKNWRQVQKDRQKKFLAQSQEPNLEKPQPVTVMPKPSPTERVRRALSRGPRTQHQIARETKLKKDEIGDALTFLLLWTREIASAGEYEDREYFIKGIRRVA